MNHVDKTKGFTLIELMLAMTFISILLVAIAMTVIQISAIYNRGITLKDVNQTGRAVSNELQRAITSSAPFSVDTATSTRYVEQGDWGGRLCLGQYSYIWNFGKALNENDPSGSSLNVYEDDVERQIRFVKVTDGNASYCADPTSKIVPDSAVELLNIGDHDLALHRLNVISEDSAADTKTRERLYTVTFYIGTNDSEALVEDSTACKGPGETGADLAYCSVQEFNVIARAGNAVE